jgi:Ca2+-binding EF-hand superfamily protein
MMGSLDSNLDGFIEKNELKGPLAGLQAKFDEADTNHTGKLTAEQLAKILPGRRMSRQKNDTPDV